MVGNWLCDDLFCHFLNNFFLLKNGMTALHLAAAKGFEQIVKILLEKGSNVHLQNRVFIFFFHFICFSFLYVDIIYCFWCDGR